MRNLRLLVEYDGTDFSGWQTQPGLRTVQGTIEESLTIILGERIRIHGSGRTDAGCHARGQVANASTAATVSCDRVLRSLAGLLPTDVAVREVREVPLDFEARRNAIQRHYSYRLLLRPSPLWNRYAWYPGFRPRLDRLRETVSPLLGDHDFRGFAGSDPTREGLHGRCRVQRCDWTEWEHGFLFHISANRFLYHMVRNIVGTAVKVARGHLEMERVQQALETADRRLAGPTAPPQGVCLERVDYLPELEHFSGATADWEAVRVGGVLP